MDDELHAATDEPDPSDPDDDAEGGYQPEDLLAGELPSLDTAAGDDLDGAVAEEADQLLGMSDEEPPRPAELPWLELPLVESVACQVVRRAPGRLVVGGSGVVQVDEDDGVHVLVQSSGDPVTSLLVEADLGTVLSTTRGGRLFRVQEGGAPEEELVSFRDACQLDRAKSTVLSLGGPTPSSRPAALLHVAALGGALLESTDRGTTWRRVDLGGRVLALSSGTPPLCWVETGDALRLFRSEPSGGFSPVGAEWSIEAEHTSIAGEGDIVALLEAGRGVHVSTDGGVSFRRAAGTARATAVAVGRLGGRPSAFAALFDAASGHTSLAWIDAATACAYVISELSPGTDQDEEDDDWAMALSLAWDAAGETLWAAGAFGLRGWRRPPSA